MSHTDDKYYADNPHIGGFTIVPAHLLKADSANLVWTRNAEGNYSLNRTAAGAETYHIVADISFLLRKLGTAAAWLAQAQELFGGSGSGILNAPGRPPYSGQSQLTVPTAQPPKGIRVTDVFPIYGVGVVNLTSATLDVNTTTYANNAAPTITAVPLTATTLTLTAGNVGNPYVIPVPVTTPAFVNTDLTDLTAEFTVVMANTGTLRVYGIGIHYDFNFN